jgi:uncharacterized protein (DUF433 family)/DNA-binding transcriptional MerR regulator
MSVLSGVFSEADNVPRIPRKPDQSLRYYPTYTVGEAATFLGIPQRTLYRWVSDNPIWESAGHEQELHLLSFYDMAQSYFLEFIRRYAHVSIRKAREILENAKSESGEPYPLLDKNIKVLFKHIIYDKPARGKHRRIVVDLSEHRQQVFENVVDLFATRFFRDRQGAMRRLFPWRLYEEGSQYHPVMIDPDVLSGRLVITGTRIPVNILWARKQADETIPDLARDYGISASVITDALRHLDVRQETAS